MMSGDNFTDGVHKPRPALGDVTNRPGKRGLLLISGNLGVKSADGYSRNVNGEQGDSQFAKQVCLGIDHSVKERTKGSVKCNEEGFSMSKDKKACGSLPTRSGVDTSIIPNLASGIKETSHSLDGGVQLVKGDTVGHNIVEVGDASRDGCLSSVSLPTCSGPHNNDCDNEGRLASNVTQNNAAHEGLVSRVCGDDEKDLGVGKLASSKHGSVEWSRLPKSQGSKSFELDRCTGLKGGGCANSSAGAELLKACSCSFCLKAAYIWSDLHYQDIKGRIAALKKSQKEANILIQKSGRGKGIGIHGQGNPSKSSKLESDLIGQWRSLFHHMEGIFVHESDQLQASFVTLKDLRENCKMDLEKTMPSDKH